MLERAQVKTSREKHVQEPSWPHSQIARKILCLEHTNLCYELQRTNGNYLPEKTSLLNPRKRRKLTRKIRLATTCKNNMEDNHVTEIPVRDWSTMRKKHFARKSRRFVREYPQNGWYTTHVSMKYNFLNKNRHSG